MPSSPLARPNDAARPREDAESVRDVGLLYERHAADVARWAARLGGRSLDVEDLVHQVFLVAQRKVGSFRGEARITTWLHGITVRVVQEARRRQRRWWRWPGPGAAHDELGETGRDEASLLSEEPSALALLEKKEAQRTVYAILDRLDEKYRTVLVLFELEGLSGEEVAVITQTSLSNVWVRLLRARKQFLRRLSQHEAQSGRESRGAR